MATHKETNEDPVYEVGDRVRIVTRTESSSMGHKATIVGIKTLFIREQLSMIGNIETEESSEKTFYTFLTDDFILYSQEKSNLIIDIKHKLED